MSERARGLETNGSSSNVSEPARILCPAVPSQRIASVPGPGSTSPAGLSSRGGSKRRKSLSSMSRIQYPERCAARSLGTIRMASS